jgi:hypothetical protein
MQDPMNPRPDSNPRPDFPDVPSGHQSQRDANRAVNPNPEPLRSERLDTEARHYADTGALRVGDLVHWGPIVAGFAATMALLILMGVLGVALGAGPFGAFWAVLSLIVAFFVGGWVCVRTLGYLGQNQSVAILNCCVVWAFTLLCVLFLAGIGVAGRMGVATIIDGTLVFGAVGVTGAITGATAWGALIGMVLGLVACLGGGVVASRDQPEYLPR